MTSQPPYDHGNAEAAGGDASQKFLSKPPEKDASSMLPIPRLEGYVSGPFEADAAPVIASVTSSSIASSNRETK